MNIRNLVAALANGDLDIDSYQHQPYLDNTVKDRGDKLVSIAQTVTFPIGLYSKKVKTLDQIPAGGRIAKEFKGSLIPAW